MSMGKMQKIANELKKKFPVQQQEGWYTLYDQSPKLDSFVNEEMGLTGWRSDNGFLFYYRCGGRTRIALTDTYFYFFGLPQESPPSGMSAIETVYVDFPDSFARRLARLSAIGFQELGSTTYPLFRIEILKMCEIDLTCQGDVKKGDIGWSAVSGTLKKCALHFMDSNENQSSITVQWSGGGYYLEIYNTMVELINRVVCRNNLISLAQDKESNLDYESAINLWERIGNQEKAKNVRRKMLDEKKVEQTVKQTVVNVDYVDDRDTIIKDSVINRSNIGAGGKSKSEELREAKALLDDGIIDDAEFQQMKKEILGK